MEKPDVIIMAAGRGTRMESDFPKSLNFVGGRPTIVRIVESARSICSMPIVVIGHGSSEFVKVLGGQCRYVFQKKQQGTGHAIICAKKALMDYAWGRRIIILPGDHPLITQETLRGLYDAHCRSGAAISLCTLKVPDFTGDNQLFSNYGRIVRDASGHVSSIIELRDATEAQKKIREVNVGYYCFETAWLLPNLERLTSQNVAGEFYITDLVGLATEQKMPIYAHAIGNPPEAMGFNTREQLAIIRTYCVPIEKISKQPNPS